MSCPFYNAQLRVEDRGIGRMTIELVTGPGRNNNCALITTADTPDWQRLQDAKRLLDAHFKLNGAETSA